MKKLLLILLLAVCNHSYGQTYISLVPSLTNSAGTISDKSNISFEVGRQWDVFSLGADIGRTNVSPAPRDVRHHRSDTSIYMEFRPNLNIFQQGKFTNTITPGAGYIFNAEETFVTEVTSGIEYAYSTTLHFNIYFGQYYYSGKYTASNVSFFGVSIMYYLHPYNTTSAIIKN